MRISTVLRVFSGLQVVRLAGCAASPVWDNGVQRLDPDAKAPCSHEYRADDVFRRGITRLRNRGIVVRAVSPLESRWPMTGALALVDEGGEKPVYYVRKTSHMETALYAVAFDAASRKIEVARPVVAMTAATAVGAALVGRRSRSPAFVIGTLVFTLASSFAAQKYVTSTNRYASNAAALMLPNQVLRRYAGRFHPATGCSTPTLPLIYRPLDSPALPARETAMAIWTWGARGLFNES